MAFHEDRQEAYSTATADNIMLISCLFEPAVLGAMSLSNIIPVKSEACIPAPPCNYQATAGSICVCQRIGLIYRFCQIQPSLPASH